MHGVRSALANTRYVLREELGRGAHGVVFRAHDPERGCDVALKAVSSSNAESEYRLKREFRLRAGIQHQNLVQLYEFGVAEGLCFYVMELVEGRTFERALAGPLSTSERVELTWRVSRQIARALLALDAHGVVHRDVKPSNIMLTDAGQALLIDFDLSARIAPLERGLDTHEAERVGTLRYMAPEVALGSDASLASDVYALAAVSYEAVSGAPPHFHEDASTLLTRRLGAAPPVPAELRREMPRFAEFLALALEPERERRPPRQRVIDLFELPSDVARRDVFCGRRAELALLEQRVTATRVCIVEGASGIGKTALVERALDALRQEQPGLTLIARCYAAERIPFNAIDAWVDGVVAFLQREPQALLEGDHLRVLARLFSQFARLPQSTSSKTDDDVQTLVPRARQAFVHTIAGLEAITPVRLFIDDFQWCDLDSLGFVKELVRRCPRLSLFLAARDLPSAHADWLQSLPADVGVRVTLTGLDAASVAKLAAQHSRALNSLELLALHEETRGNPFLVQWVLADETGRSSSVEDSLSARCDALSPEARRLLSLLCLAGAPLARTLLQRLCGRAEVELEQAALSHRALSGQHDALSPAHDRISDFIERRLERDERVRLHAELARALAVASPETPALVAHHFSRADQAEDASRWHVQAAVHASQQFAWSAASEHYAAAFSAHDADKPELWRAFGHASENAGQPAQAARAFRRASELSRDAFDSIRAAEVLWGTGAVEAGKDAVRDVLKRAGLRFTASNLEGIAAGQWWRYRARFASRAENEPRLAQRLRCELCFAVGGALAVADAMSAYALQGRAVYEAAQTGVPEDLVRALGPELIYVGATGRAEARRNSLHLRLREESARCSGSIPRGLSALCVGYEAFLRGELSPALEALSRARSAFREQNYLGWPSKLATRGWAWVLWLSGRYAEFRDALHPLIEAARDASDWLTWMQISALSVHESLLDGDIERAQQRLDEIHRDEIREVPFGTGFVLDHARWQVQLYAGDFAAAQATSTRVAKAWRPVMRFAHVRVEHRWFSALGRLAHDQSEAGTRFAEDCAHRLLAEQLTWARALGQSLRAAVRARRRDVSGALADYEAAALALGELGFAAHAAAAELLGALTLRDQTRAAQISAELRERGVRDVPRWLRITMAAPTDPGRSTCSN